MILIQNSDRVCFNLINSSRFRICIKIKEFKLLSPNEDMQIKWRTKAEQTSL